MLRKIITLLRRGFHRAASGWRRRAAARDQAVLEAIVDALPDYIWISDASLRKTIYISAACENLLGVPRDALLGDRRHLIRRVHSADRRRVYEARRVVSGGTYNETYRIVRPDGSIRWVQDRAFPVHDAAGEIYRIAGIAVDVTDRKRMEDELLALAYLDALTGLPNRALLLDRLGQAIAQARRNEWALAVLFIDVDKLKAVNDTFGHASGDELLKQSAKRLLACMRSGDTVGRLAGDEFCVVLTQLSAANDVALVATKILNVLNNPFDLGHATVHVSASIGISMFPTDSIEPEVLIGGADLAMYSAKQAGGNRYRFYASTMDTSARASRRKASG